MGEPRVRLEDCQHVDAAATEPCREHVAGEPGRFAVE
jgi:hypothetical protein